ncbi:hypothetical protein ALC56_03782 [Trachymyrmex septentrionalis]|uniref:Uncharacterized protein n=1 Tax=Trachymyrmex septentrionalis TaxID=34720 RepID=A0A195FNG3_9HYME|nr:hypothetical protein ALC56_03782 [Trachymyrmex septentrionalis]
MAERERSTVIKPAIRYFEVHPIVASADCETRMQIPARILRVYTFRFSKKLNARPIMLKNLITVAKLLYLMNAANVMTLNGLYVTMMFLQIVFLGMLGIVLQGSQDSRGDRRCNWQMLALRMETSFIGAVAQADGTAVVISIAERSLNAKSVLVFGDIEKLTLLLAFMMLITVYSVIKSKLRRRLLYSIAEKPVRYEDLPLIDKFLTGMLTNMHVTSFLDKIDSGA